MRLSPAMINYSVAQIQTQQGLSSKEANFAKDLLLFSKTKRKTLNQMTPEFLFSDKGLGGAIARNQLTEQRALQIRDYVVAYRQQHLEAKEAAPLKKEKKSSESPTQNPNPFKQES